jgi:hydroxymethylglutaryl-CoA lyase
MERITWVECPRDAMQGWHRLFSLDEKVHYVQELAHVGFDVLDVGSFVSPRAVPQMADTAQVVQQPLRQLKGIGSPCCSKLRRM